MSRSKIIRFLFAPPGTPEYELGYAIGNALRAVIVGKRRTRSDRPPKKETPAESFRKLADDNKGVFGNRGEK